MRPRTAVLSAALLVCPAPRALTAFEKGGLLDAGPRQAALAGAGVALDGDVAAAPSCPAGLARLAGLPLTAGYGFASQADLGTMVTGAGAVLEGIGCAGLLQRTASAAGSELALLAAAGLPLEEAPGVSLGAGVRYLSAELGADRASGFSLDAGIMFPVPLPWKRWEASGAAGVEDALGGLTWTSGLTETPARQWRAGVAARWAERTTLVAELREIRSDLGRESVLALGAEHEIAIRGIPVALRAGWRDGQARQGVLTAGLGTRVGPASLDVALAGANRSQGWLNIFALTWRLPGAGGGEPGSRGLRGSGSGAAARPPGEPLAALPEAETIRLASAYRTIRFALRAPPAGVNGTWSLVILDRRGDAVWSAEGEGTVPAQLEWNGVADDGTPARPGAYDCQLVIRGPGGYRKLSRPARFRLERAVSGPAGPPPDEPGGF